MLWRNIVAGSLKGKLVACFVAVSAAQILILGYLSFNSAKDGLEQAALNKLYSERELKKGELHYYFRETMQNLQFLSQTEAARSAADSLRTYHEYNKTSQDTPFDTTSELYNQMYTSINLFFKSFLDSRDAKSSGYEDVYLVSASDGSIMFTTLKQKDLGANLRKGDLKQSGLAKLVEKVIKTKSPATVDFEVYEPTGKPEMFMGVPVLGPNNTVDAVLALRIGPQKINSIVGSFRDAGKTTEAYIVGGDLLMRSQSRVGNESSILGQKVDTEAAKNALQDKSGTGIARNYRGTEVLTSYSHVGLNETKDLGAGFDWAVIVEMNTDEAFGAVQSLRNRMIIIALLIAGVSVLVAFLIGGAISKPIVGLADKMAQIGNGDLSVNIPYQTRHDEVGILSRAISSMVNDLRDQIGRIIDGMNVLSSSASEISTTVAQVATSSAQTSSAMTETTVTVEELRQSSQRAGVTANNVAMSAKEAVKTSVTGREATEDMVKMMRVIKEQMASIGETVVRLSDHSRAIENIMASVQDLADQSNLLAVNASIEAARAGESGKGFAVVAHEIKTLADQSKDATSQVRSILEETRKWVSAVVMTTEQGGKAVEAGLQQSISAGEAIEKLYDSVEKSSNAATEIKASSDQQAVAIDQVSDGMGNIDQAMRQNVGSTSQLEKAARNLADLGEQLKELVQRYRIQSEV